MPFVCLCIYVYVCPSLALEWLNGFSSYLVFKSCCFTNMNILSPKIGAFQMEPQKQNWNFLRNSSNDFY
jgi:hypothetical protein